ncbi:MAG: hypothetical protein KF708_13395 [Pirellulales bacterium]|nr:hypothetical protein [Pirellulales bacterium]
MMKSRPIAIACLAASVLGLAAPAFAQGWGGTVPPWGAPTAASRSTVPSNAAGAFNSYYPAYGSYPDPIENRYSVVPRGISAADSRYGHTAGRVVTGYPGETVYYHNGAMLQPQGLPATEQVLPPTRVAPQPYSAPPAMMPAPGMPNPCYPAAACGQADPCCPPCPASWQHRCGQRMGDMLSRMKECCDKFCESLANCCPKPKPQPCCWTGYQAWWHAPQPNNCLMNECLTENGAAMSGQPLGMEMTPPGAEVLEGTWSDGYESAESTGEIVEEGPSFIEYGRPTYDDVPLTIPSAPAPTTPAPTKPAPSSISTPAKPAGHVENELSTPRGNWDDDATQVEAPELPLPEVVLPPQDDTTT